MISAVSAGQGLGPLLLALTVTLFAGFVKGAVGFAMPLIMISAFSAFLPPELALAGLILPTLVTNLSQAFRQGIAPAKQTAWTYRRFLIGTVVFIALSAQLFDLIPRVAYLLLLGVPVTAFAALQLAGVPLALRLQHRTRAEWGLGVIGGLYGGVSGIWGPPLLVYLLSINAPKLEAIRAQGVVFLIGAVALLAAHLGTGLANVQTLLFSAALVVPAQIGMGLGYRLQDRLPQARFRRWTQALLVVTGLNLVLQALVA
ncbi:sulfite exporter TauE/SafE family protein [Rhodobacter sp. ETT8]|uniref:Probable membrane transporter protein n=2 Tax=Pseudotabrizicola algicola TaxID=2709381 RepID=A0A6B3RL01_9RHOB|nr:sulfite exporter TauE/SafE family protein [Pseudotabrizicola algicola]